MRSLPLLVWMLGWPLALNLSDLLEALAAEHGAKPLSEGANNFAAGLWLAVGVVLFVKSFRGDA